MINSLLIDYDPSIPAVYGFFGDFHFLSNFHPCTLNFMGIDFNSSEHAYVWSKTVIPTEQNLILGLSNPGKVKLEGYKLTIRPGWNDMRVGRMEAIIRHKFVGELAERLLATGNRYLEETNYWNDEFWGVCNGVGENHMGMLLMMVREELREMDG